VVDLYISGVQRGAGANGAPAPGIQGKELL